MSNFTFGAPTGTPAFGAPAAQNQAAAPGTTFGATPAPSFGATPAPSFGAPATSAAPTFGAAAAQAALPTLGTTNFNFSQPTAATTAAPTFSFGSSPATAAAPTAAPTSLATSGTPTLSFNTGANLATSTAATLPTLAGLGGSNFTLGKTPAVTTTPATLNFGTSTSQAPQNFSLGVAKPNNAATTSAPTATNFVGLGGLDMSATQPKAGENKPNNIKAKETLVPDEITKTVEALKSHIKTQKQLSSDIGRTSTSKLSNVNGAIGKMQFLLREISNSVESNFNQIRLLRKESSKTIQSLEIAQRTQDTPAGLQYENTAPFQYFQELVIKYEQDLLTIRTQIALTERHMQSITSPQSVKPEDLTRCFQQINESFISLAGRVHEVHQKVEAQKEQFLSLRKYRLRDSSNVFAKLEEVETKTMHNSSITHGPSPFQHYSAMDSFGRSFASNLAAAAAVGNTTNK